MPRPGHSSWKTGPGRALVLLAVLLCLAGSSACLPSRPAATPGAWRPKLVILVSIDTCRADHLGCYGYRRPTSPFLDRLAAEGTLFENAFSQSNESLFSYGSIMTGRYARQVSPLNRATFRVPEGVDTLAQQLGSYGVDTTAFVAGGHLNRRFGTCQGFGVWRDRWDFGSFYDTFPPAFRYLGTRAASTGPPTFLFLQGYDVHEPYQKPGPFRNLYDPGYTGVADEIVTRPNALERVYRDRWYPSYPAGELARRVLAAPDGFDRLQMLRPMYGQGSPGRALSPADLGHLVAAYDSAVSYADTWLGLLMARLRELGLEEQTLLVVIGDHGEELGEHGYYGHRRFLDDVSLHVPLVIWGPGGVPKGRRIRDVVELRELRATVADYLGLSPGAGSRAGLRPLIEGRVGDAAGGDVAISEGLAPQLTIRSADWRLTYMGTLGHERTLLRELGRAPLDGGEFTLFDVRTDPLGTRDLVGSKAGRQAAETLRTLLVQRLQETTPPSPAGSVPP